MPEKGDRLKVLGLSFLGQFLYQVFYILGLDNTSAGNTGFILGATPVITAFFSSIVLKEKAGGWVWPVAGVLAAPVGLFAVLVGAGALPQLRIPRNPTPMRITAIALKITHLL